MSREATRRSVQEAIRAFDGGNLRRNAARLLNALGYSSDKTFDISPNTFAGFFTALGQRADTFNSKNAKADDWQSADIRFPLTDKDMMPIPRLPNPHRQSRGR